MDKIHNQILASIPDSIDFNFITVKNESIRTITLDNPASMSIVFKIENSEGYIFEPSEGIIPNHRKTTILIKIVPESAVVLIANALITLDNKASKIIKLSSIAKYPYLTINKKQLDFGVLQIGKSTTRELVVTNPETVPAKFVITKTSVQPGKHPEVFFFSDIKGEVPPMSSFLITATYKTFFVGINSYDTYEIKTIGGNVGRFSCSGLSTGLKSWLNTKSVNFNSIQLGSKITKLIRIYNDSDQVTDFQIYHDNDGVFAITPLDGTIPPHSNIRIQVTFRPYETLLYYERFFCLVKNHIVIPLDVYGSCHDLLNKSRILNQKYIDIFRYKLLNGLYFTKVTPENNELVEKLTRTLGNKSGASSEEATFETITQTQLHKELFWENTSLNRIISIDTEHIDFRFVGNGSLSESYIVKLRNNTSEKVRVKWILEKPINTSNLLKAENIFANENTVFIIQPEEEIINKHSQSEFKVYFKPNKPEYYFYSNITCQATLMSSYEETNPSNQNSKNGKPTLLIDEKSTSKYGSKRNLRPIPSKTMSSFGYKNKLPPISDSSSKGTEYFDPPFPVRLSIVGHSFPPGNQIFMPMYELTPSDELYFPPSSILQSLYQTLKIKNNSDTPLYYNFSCDPLNIFRIHRKYGLIPANSFHLVCIEFCPQDCTVYRYPLRVVFNHDNLNMKTIILNGLSCDPVIEIEGVKNEIYFPPSYLGLRTKKTLTIINRSPIKVNVQITTEQSENGSIEVNPSQLEMDTNLVRDIDVTLCPLKNEEIQAKLCFTVERIYDSLSEYVGIYNPGSISLKSQLKPPILLEQLTSKRQFKREIKILGRGSDGDLALSPLHLSFGTVKVGFHKQLTFSIYNPTITNFYIKLEVDPISDEKKQKDSLSFDFTEGLINSFCKKEVTVTFRPITRSAVQLVVRINAVEFLSNQEPSDFSAHQSKKCELVIEGNGDYPLIKIADIRNDSIGTSALWHSFNVDEANEELQKQLTDEEILYMSNDKGDKKITEFKDKLKCIKVDFGKHIKKKNAPEKEDVFDVYLTLKNEGGVTSEFYFKFPDDISIKREIWMDPVEPTSNDKVEYHVLKEKIFEIEPRKSKLEPNECCNIRLRYNKKERGDHRLRVIFQIVNGKPLIFELSAQCFSEKIGMLEIRRPTLDFSFVAIGYMSYVVAPIELCNAGGIKIKYQIDMNDVDNFNLKNNNFEIFKLENQRGTIGSGDFRYITVFFRPLTDKQYILNLKVHFTDEIETFNSIPICIKGIGYHPIQYTPPVELSPYRTMPKDRMCNKFNDNYIQKCGVSVEEIDFGYVKDKPKNKTFILYNFSKTTSLTFDFREAGFLLKDELDIKPNKQQLEPNSHILIKMVLIPKTYISRYEGEIEINITWNAENSNKVLEKEKLYIRIRKRSELKEISGIIEKTENENQSFIETVLSDLTREILCDQSFDKMLCEQFDNQPMGIFDWTSDTPYPSQEEVRNKIITNYIRKAKTKIVNEQTMGQSVGKRGTVMKNTISMSINPLKTSDVDLYGDIEDMNIQEKYMNELLTKYKLTIPEVNERLIVVNEESRNLISNVIMESTIYNIISEAVYGETDLTEKTKIYFFNKKY